MVAIYRIREWEEFKRLVLKFRPKILFYVVERSPLSRPPIALRLVFIHGRDTYAFLDFARGDHLTKTNLPVINPKGETPWVSMDALRRFVSEELGDVELVDFSMTTIL